MTESKEREAYRKACRHYGVEQHCYKQSRYWFDCGIAYAHDILCTPDCDCARMIRYDKRKKD